MSVVGFCGVRRLQPWQRRRVWPVVASVVRAGRGVAVGCSAGVDATVIFAALAAGGASSLSVVAAFGSSGSGAWSGSALLPVWVAERAGASVAWWAGGRGSLRSRLARRSMACVCAVSGTGFGAGFVGFVDLECPEGLLPRPAWSSSGSGSWSSVALAAGIGLPVVVFPLGWSPVAAGGLVGAGGPAPAWPGRWVPAAASGPWAGSWRWVAPAGLFRR